MKRKKLLNWSNIPHFYKTFKTCFSKQHCLLNRRSITFIVTAFCSFILLNTNQLAAQCIQNIDCNDPLSLDLGPLTCNDAIVAQAGFTAADATPDVITFMMNEYDIDITPVSASTCVLDFAITDVFDNPAQNQCTGGDVTRTIVFTDGNMTTFCTRTYTLTAPAITLTVTAPPPANVECFGDIAIAVQAAIDNGDVITNNSSCNLNPVITASDPVLQTGADGCPTATYEVIYTVTDDCGNTGTDTQIFTLDGDIAPPSLPVIDFCPMDLTVACLGDVDINAQIALVQFTTVCGVNADVTASTPLGDPSNDISCDDVSGNIFTIDYTVTDVCTGVSLPCTQTITIQNDGLQLLDASGDPIDDTALSDLLDDITFNDPNMIVDSDGNLILECIDAGALPPNVVYDTQIELWILEVKALINAQVPTPGLCDVTYPNNITVDNYSAAGDLPLTLDCSSAPSATVRFRVRDNCGRTLDFFRDIILTDTEPPVFLDCPTDPVQVNGCDENDVVALTGLAINTIGDDITPADIPQLNLVENCNLVLLKYSDVVTNGGTPDCPITTVTRTFFANDNCTTPSIECTVTYVVSDTEGPIINCPPDDATLVCGGALPAPETMLSGTDNCDTGTDFMVIDVEDTDLPTTFCATDGRQVARTYTVADACGNLGTCVQTFTFIVDLNNPVIDTQASSETVECDVADLQAWLDSNGGAAASDDCGAIIWSNNFTALNMACGITGDVTVTFTANDGCGNTAPTTATYTIVDTNPPSIDAEAQDANVECDVNTNMDDLTSWLDSNGGAISSDLCGDVIWTNDFTALSDLCAETGTATVTFTATDECGLTATTTASFTIGDSQGPVFDNPPANLSLNCEDPVPLVGSLTATDACGGTFTDIPVEIIESDDDCIFGETITRIWEVTDGCGFTTTHIQTITVSDNEPPALALENANENVFLDCGDAIPPVPAVIVTDNCSPNLTVDPPAVTDNNADVCENDRLITRTWTVTDDCGNESMISQNITISSANCTIGCTDPSACNYDVNADCDDDSCIYFTGQCNAECEDGDVEEWDTDLCECVVVSVTTPGCTSPMACNYNANANCDDGSCDITMCNTDPCNGDIEIVSADGCSCIVEEPQDIGCDIQSACNYNSDANCIDNSTCDFGDGNCAANGGDRCNPIAGCINPNACNFDANACISDGSCTFAPCNPGCTDPCANNYDAAADADDGSCNPYNNDCNTNCIAGDLEIWNPNTCSCEVDILTVFGCTNQTACNFDPGANCDDGSCDLPPAQPDTECYQTATFNPFTCDWDVTGTQPTPISTACYETAIFNNITCAWEVSGDQPLQPAIECYEVILFDDISCDWVVFGSQPAEPATACYETATFNNNSCEWDVSGDPPAQDPLECWEQAFFDDLICNWVYIGSQPAEPFTTCYQTVTFNSNTCTWNNPTGNQPAQPTNLACYESVGAFDDAICAWQILGTQPTIDDGCGLTVDSFDSVACAAVNTSLCPAGSMLDQVNCVCVTNVLSGCTNPCATNYNPMANQDNGSCNLPEEPETACYQTATFNNNSCEWNVIGDPPNEPITACYETATFNNNSCEWNVTGEQPDQPVRACYETAIFSFYTCEWVVTGEQDAEPVTGCNETANFNPYTCTWVIVPNTPTCNDYDSCTTDSYNYDLCECEYTPSCSNDNTAPVITPNWPGSGGVYNGMQMNMTCGNITYFDDSFVNVTDNCDDDIDVTFTDNWVAYGDCNTDGYQSMWYCEWAATDNCGNTTTYGINVTIVCAPCDDGDACTVDSYEGCDCIHEPIPNCGIYQQENCTYTADFYGDLYSSYGGETCSDILNNCLSNGAISLGLYGRSVTVFTTDCIGALLPSYGGVSLLPQGNTSYSGSCGYTQPLGNALAAHLLTLKLNILNNPDIAHVNINDQIGCLLAPQSVLQQCGGNYTVGQLSLIADYALGGYYGTDQNLLNDIYIALCLINDGLAFCEDPCVYIKQRGDTNNVLPIKNNEDAISDVLVEEENLSILINQNIASGNLQITLNLEENENNGIINILQLNGQILLKEDFSGVKGQNQISIDLNTLPVGIYYVSVQTANNINYLEKLIKY